MAKIETFSKNVKPRNVVEKNIALTGKLMQHLLSKPHLFDALPDSFELVILPEDDPAMRQYNLELLDKYVSEDKPLIFVRMKSSQTADFDEMEPSLYVPLAA